MLILKENEAIHILGLMPTFLRINLPFNKNSYSWVKHLAAKENTHLRFLAIAKKLSHELAAKLRLQIP
jgi:hypothetical protein